MNHYLLTAGVLFAIFSAAGLGGCFETARELRRKAVLSDARQAYIKEDQVTYTIIAVIFGVAAMVLINVA